MTKLVEKCTENIDGVKIAGMALFEGGNECKSSCTIYVVLIAILFTISIGIGTYFIYYKYMNHDKKLILNLIMSTKNPIISINGKYQRNKHWKSNLLFSWWYDQYQKHSLKLTKNIQEVVKRHWYLLYWIHHNWEIWWLCKYWQCKSATGHFKEKNDKKYLILD